MLAVILVLALGAGISLGMLGGGGSALTVPILIHAAGMAPKAAIATSLVVVGIVSLVGLIGHFKAGALQLKPALLFAPLTMIGAYTGARLAVHVSGSVQLWLFGIMLVLTAIAMLRKPKSGKSPPRSQFLERYRVPIIAVVGILTGIITGLTGTGGGFLVVPALVFLAGLDMRQAIGTSLFVIALNTAAGFLGYMDQVTFEIPFIAAYVAASGVGVLVGAVLANRIPQHYLRRGFASMLAVIGVVVVAGV